MNSWRWLAVLAVSLAATPESPAIANVFMRSTRDQVEAVNKTISGKVLDFTHNHGKDCRIWSPALCARRDLYVYLPPGYDGRTPFPIMYLFHGFGQDEKNFLDIVPYYDRAICRGELPPMIIAVPDGSVNGDPSLFNSGSFYLNTKSGRYQDFVMDDVWEFLNKSFVISPARGAHILAGGSMGGFAAYNLGFKYRERFGVLVGLLPPLSLRYSDCHGRYFAPYDPNCVMNRDKARPHMTIAKFYCVIRVPEKRMTRPVIYARPRNAMPEIAQQNPVEMLDTYDIKPGEFAMYVGFAGKDEFNLGAQAEHFIDHARCRGLAVTAYCVPDGKHRTTTGLKLFPSMIAFLLEHVGPFAPKVVCPEAGALIVPLARAGDGAPILPLEAAGGRTVSRPGPAASIQPLEELSDRKLLELLVGGAGP